MVPRGPDSTKNAQNPTNAGSADSSTGSQYQFDWLNWLYWSMWWQQYSYWAWSQSLSGNQAQTNGTTSTNTSTSTSSSSSHQSTGATSQVSAGDANHQGVPHYNPYYQYYPYYPPAGGAPTWAANYQGHPHQSIGGMAQPQAHSNVLTLQIRLINGFETYIAAPWKRMVAEIIDTVLFALLLKAYLPEADLRSVGVGVYHVCVGVEMCRIPEILLEGADVWTAIEEEEDLEEIQNILQIFVFSIIMQRMHHAVLEAVWVAVFSCTPGKWFMGLRVLRCTSVHFTRTQPGRTIRVVPGGRIPLWRSLTRSLFKSIFSLFCPLVIFFFSLHRGQTKYDQLLRCAVVDAHSLYRPVHTNRGPIGQGPPQPQVVRIG